MGLKNIESHAWRVFEDNLEVYMIGFSEAGRILRGIGIDPRDYFDPLLSESFGRPVFDSFKFDEWLTERFGESGKSSHEIMHERFPEVADTLEELFCV